MVGFAWFESLSRQTGLQAGFLGRWVASGAGSEMPANLLEAESGLALEFRIPFERQPAAVLKTLQEHR